MVDNVNSAHFDLADFPQSMESGTPAIEGAIGLAAVCKHLDTLGLERIREHERIITQTAIQGLLGISRARVLCPSMRLQEADCGVSCGRSRGTWRC